jgi:hypothetical protein
MQRLDDFDRRLKLVENSSSTQQIEENVVENTPNDDLQF